VAQQYADGLVTDDAWTSADEEFQWAFLNREHFPLVTGATVRAALCCLLPTGFEAAWSTMSFAASAVGWAVVGDKEIPSSEARQYWTAACEGARTKECREQLTVLRHIIGNPFRPYPASASWPSTVVQLAESLYNGVDCRLLLSEALEEVGHVELAEHFSKEQWHPKGCWVMDMILGKS
jgi:hypothetical protein